MKCKVTIQDPAAAKVEAVCRGIVTLDIEPGSKSARTIMTDWIDTGLGSGRHLIFTSYLDGVYVDEIPVGEERVFYGRSDYFKNAEDIPAVPEVRTSAVLSTETGRFRLAVRVKPESFKGTVRILWTAIKASEVGAENEVPEETAVSEETAAPEETAAQEETWETEETEPQDAPETAEETEMPQETEAPLESEALQETEEAEGIVEASELCEAEEAAETEETTEIGAPEAEEEAEAPETAEEAEDAVAVEAAEEPEAEEDEALEEMEEEPSEFYIENIPQWLHTGWKYTFRVHQEGEAERTPGRILWSCESESGDGEAYSGSIDKYGQLTAPVNPGVVEVTAVKEGTDLLASCYVVITA